MPQTVSNLSLKMLKELSLPDRDVLEAEFPVWIESRVVNGYYPAFELKRLMSEREDLNYIGKITRNCDKQLNGTVIPGFSFVREGAESLNEFVKQMEPQRARAAAPESPEPPAPEPSPQPI